MLASGTGTILEAILAAGLPVAVVVADRPCRALTVAAEAGVPAVRVERTSFGDDFDRLAHTHEVVDALEAHRVELVAMAGFGTILDKPVHDAFPGRILNTHPALLPAFPGWHAVEDAIQHGVKVTGCTFHIVDATLDGGPIVLQEPVTIAPDDDEATLHARIKAVEHRLLPRAVALLVASAVAIDGRRTRVDAAAADHVLTAPRRALLSVSDKTGLAELGARYAEGPLQVGG